MCPFCRNRPAHIKKSGRFPKKTGRCPYVQRYLCRDCGKSFSDATTAPTFKQRKPHLNRKLFDLLAAGVSQRKCAELLRIHRKTVARRLLMLGKTCRERNQKQLAKAAKVSTVVFDEMETFEHTKCKPLSIALAVEEKSRRILAVHVSQMPAKGHLARIAMKRYGYRPDKRREGLTKLMQDIKERTIDVQLMKSDECPRYPLHVRRHFPLAEHLTYKGRRACVVGQGELKAGGFDPLFSLNHTCAMFRDNVKRLARRTWCTTKKKERLQDLLDIYTAYHNWRVSGRARRTLRLR